MLVLRQNTMMRTLRFLPILILLAKLCCAQTDIQSLENTLKDQQLWLRNYAADRTVQYDWNNGVLVHKPTRFRTLGAFVPHAITYKDNKLIFKGDRSTLVRDRKQGKTFLTGKTQMTLEVNLQNADPGIVIPHIRQMLFFPDMQTAEANLPQPYADRLPFDISKTPEPKGAAEIFLDNQWSKLEFTKITPPKLVSSVEPQLTDEARRAKARGSVYLIFVVSSSGHVEGIWSAFPFGFGLEEKAVDAVQKYVFKPAKYEDKPVGTPLQVEVNFEVR